MIVSSEKKLKQALLQFKTTSNEKKRKLDDETNSDEAKCRKLSFDNLGRQNQQPVDNKTELVNKDLKAADDASVMNVDIVDLCGDSESSSDGNSCPRNIDSSQTNATLPSTPETPKRKTSEALSSDKIFPHSGTNSVENNAEKVLPNKITPKQSREERERLKQEKERLKQEKEKERLAKLEAKEEEKRQKEEERKAKEEEKRQKAQAKEEERRQKEEERKAKEEEKRQKAQTKEEERRQKEEERKAKEEEKRMKDEEKRQREELEKKNKEKSAALFTNFFLKSKNTPMKTQPRDSSNKEITTKFMPFEVKDNMRLASIQRVVLTPDKLRYLDEILSRDTNMSIDSLYLTQLRSKNYVPGHSGNTWPLNANDDDDDVKDVTPKYRCKLLQFRENRRPAYWGTWRKQSKTISARRPFKLDTTYFEYDIDSDDEWVDEEPGESLGGSEDDLESEDDYEVDNDMFVPHGYLSDEEGQPDSVPEGSPKSHKQKLNLLEKQFEAEMKEKTSKLKPRVYGCIWISNEVEKNGRDEIEHMLLTYRAVWNEDRTPFHVNLKVENLTPTTTPSSKSKSTPQTVPVGVLKEFPESLIADLIRLVHGNKLSGQKLVDEFKLYALSVDSTLNLTKSCLFNKIREIASWTPNLACWMVNDDIRQQHNLSDLSPTENRWKYICNFETASSKKSQNVAEKTPSAVPAAIVTTPTSSGKAKKLSSITPFIRVYRASDKEKQTAGSTTPEPEK